MLTPMTPEEVNALLGLTCTTEAEARYGPAWRRCADTRAEVAAFSLDPHDDDHAEVIGTPRPHPA